MKKLLLIGLTILLTTPFYSQTTDKNISLEIKYPIPFGNNFLNKGLNNGYQGIIDLGIDYNFLKIKGIGIGLLVNSSLLKLSEVNPNVSLWTLSPKIKFDYNINLGRISIIPRIGIGYSLWSFSSSNYNSTDNGISINGATKFVYNTGKKLDLFLVLSYEYTRLEKPENLTSNFNYNQNTHQFCPGLGVIWNFSKE